MQRIYSTYEEGNWIDSLWRMDLDSLLRPVENLAIDGWRNLLLTPQAIRRPGSASSSSTTSDDMPLLVDVASDDELQPLEELPPTPDDVIYCTTSTTSLVAGATRVEAMLFAAEQTQMLQQILDSAFPGGPNPLHPWDKILIAQRAQRAFEAQRAQRVQRGSERLLPSLDIAPQAMNTGKAARLRFLNGPFFHTYVKKTQGVRYVHVFQRSAKGGNPNANATPEQQCTRCPYHERALVEREVERLLTTVLGSRHVREPRQFLRRILHRILELV